jgi:GT2 family glycosyltransferase
MLVTNPSFAIEIEFSQTKTEFRISNITQGVCANLKSVPLLSNASGHQIVISHWGIYSHKKLLKHCKKIISDLSLDLENEIHLSFLSKCIYESFLIESNIMSVTLLIDNQISAYYILKSLALGQSAFFTNSAIEVEIEYLGVKIEELDFDFDKYSFLKYSICVEISALVKQLAISKKVEIIPDKNVEFEVIIPTLLKNFQMLRDCLDSIFKSSMKPNKIVFVVPNEETFRKDFLSEFEIPIHFQILEGSDNGVGFARQHGLMNSSGNLVAFVDDDDTVEGFYFERLLLAMNADAQLDAVGSWLRSFGYTKAILPQFDSLPIIGGINCCPAAGVLMWRRTALKDLGGFDTSFARGYEDFDLVARATNSGMRIRVIDEPLYNYRRHPKSTSSSYDFNSEVRLRDMLISKIDDFDSMKILLRLLFVSDHTIKTASPFYWRDERKSRHLMLRGKYLVKVVYHLLPHHVRARIYNFLKSI